MVDRVVAKAPSTIANLGYGFDVLALAVDYAYDIVEVWFSDKRGVAVHVEGPYSHGVPSDPYMNTAGIVALKVLGDTGVRDFGVEMIVWKNVPPRRGLGSSAASAAATAVALNELLGLRMAREELVRLAAEGERASAGTPHYDNVSAAVLGGLTIVDPYGEVVEKIEPPKTLKILVAIPLRVSKPSTREARKLLPARLELSTVYREAAKTALTVLAFAREDCSLLERAMAGARVVEEARSKLYPYYHVARRVLEEEGASAAGLAGAGPSLFAIYCDATPDTEDIAVKLYGRTGIEFRVELVSPEPNGARIVAKI